MAQGCREVGPNGRRAAPCGPNAAKLEVGARSMNGCWLRGLFPLTSTYVLVDGGGGAPTRSHCQDGGGSACDDIASGEHAFHRSPAGLSRSLDRSSNAMDQVR